MNYGKRIKRIREKENISIETIAKGINVTEDRYSKWEDNKEDLTIEDLNKICQFLNIEVSEIIENKSSKIVKPRKWLYKVFIILIIIIDIILINKIFFSIYNTIQNENAKADNKRFNNILKNNIGTQYGTTILSTLDEIIINNNKSYSNQITIIYNNNIIDDINELKKEIRSINKYNVSESYDPDGYINNITIELIEDNERKYK